MNRFGDGDFYGEDDYRYEEEEFEVADNDSIINSIPTDLVDKWKQSEMHLEDKKVNQIVLKYTIHLLQQSFWWKFRSLQSKLHLIIGTYDVLDDLVHNE